MKKNKLFESLNHIDEKIIQEAEKEEYMEEKKFRPMKILIPIGLAALIIFMILPKFWDEEIVQEEIIIDEDLPKVSIGNFQSQGAGFEALMAYSIDDLINENPWDEKSNISTLPVFKNKLEYSEEGILENIDLQAMRKRLNEIINLLGLKAKDLKSSNSSIGGEETNEIIDKIESSGGTENYYFNNYIELYAKNKDYNITVFPDLSASINFKKKEKMAKNYYIDYRSSYKDVSKASKYVSKEYKKFLGMKEPIINIYDGDFSYDGDQKFQLSFFEGKGSLEEKIINYNFNQISIYFDEEDRSNTLDINNPDLSKRIGNYPIISSSEAEKLLIVGKYLTNVPIVFPGKEYIKKVELVYRGQYEEYLMPYYLFYIELEELKEANGLKTFGAYYVPAIEEEYIDNMDIMDPKFN